MICSVHRLQGSDRPTTIDVDLDELGGLRPDESWVWLDLSSPSADDIDRLANALKLDELTVDDINEERQFPKVEEFDAYLTVVLHSLSPNTERLATVEVDAILTSRVLVTIHDEDLPGIEFVRDRILGGLDVPATPDELLADLTEIAARRFLPVVDELDLRVLDAQELALCGDPEVLAEVQALQRDAAVMRRMLGPQRQLLLGLSRDRRSLIDDRARRVFRDAYDDHVRTVESLDSANNMLSSALDTYRGAAAERMNEVMKVLTVFSATLLPLTLIVGIYGMNFQYMPETQQRWGYPAVLVLMVTIAGSLFVYFVRRGFVSGLRRESIGGGKARGLGRAGVGVAKGLGRGLGGVAAIPVRTIGGHRRRRPRPPE